MKRVALFLVLLLLGHLVEQRLARVEGQVLPIGGGRSGSGGSASPSGSNGDVQVKSGTGFGAYGGASCSILGQFASAVSSAGAITCSTPSGSAVSVAGSDGNLQIKSGTTLAAYAGTSCAVSGQVATVSSASGAFTCATPTALNTVANTSDGTLLARSGVYSVSGYAGSSCSIAGQFVATVSTAGVVTCATPSGSGSGTVSTGAAGDLAVYSGSTTIAPAATGVATYSSSTLFVPALQTTGSGASITMTNVAGTSTPASGQVALYTNSSSKELCTINDAGTVACLPSTSVIRVCIFENDGQGATLSSSNITGRKCDVPFAATIVEVTVMADAGVPAVMVERYRPNGGSTASLLTGPAGLQTAASGAFACARSSTSATCYSGVTSSASVTVTNTSLSAGDILRISAATANGSNTWHNVAIIYTIN